MQVIKPNKDRGLGGINKIIKQIDKEIDRHTVAIDESVKLRNAMLKHAYKLEDRLLKIADYIVSRLDAFVDARAAKVDAKVTALMQREAALQSDQDTLVKARVKVVETLSV